MSKVFGDTKLEVQPGNLTILTGAFGGLSPFARTNSRILHI